MVWKLPLKPQTYIFMDQKYFELNTHNNRIDYALKLKNPILENNIKSD